MGPEGIPLEMFLRRLRRGGLWLGCVLLFIYGALVVSTARQENRLRDILNQRNASDCLYCARVVGATWPN
jgi:hypothetical protein